MKVLLLLLIACFAIGSFGCGEKEETTRVSDLTPQAKEFVDLLVKEDYASAVKSFDNKMKEVMPEDKVQEAWQGLLAQTGPFKKQIGVRQSKEQGYDVVYVTCEFEKSSLDIKLVFDSAKKVSGLWFVPSTPR